MADTEPIENIVEVMTEKGKKTKSMSRKGMRYPTQCMKVGEIACLFVSCFYRGRSPMISIGPSWPFTFILFFLTGVICVYFYLMLLINGDKAHPTHRMWCYSTIVANMLCLILGILKNPGIP